MPVSQNTTTQPVTKNRPNSRTGVAEIVEKIRKQIHQGQWAKGQELPPVRQLARKWGVSSNTITAAQSLLEQDGTLRRVARKGVFVCDSSELREKPVLLIGHMNQNAKGENWSQRVTLGTLEELNRRQMKFNWPQWERPTDGSDWEEACKIIMQHKDQISGVILAWAICSETQMQQMVQAIGKPIIKVGRYCRKCFHNFVSVDHFEAGNIVAQHTRHLINDRVLILSGHAPHDFPRRQLIEGFMDGLLEHHESLVHCDAMQLASVQEEDCHKAIKAYLENNPMPQVVYASGDLLAIRAMNALQALGHRVPADVSVVSSTGLDLAQVCTPTLAHVRQPLEDLGTQAVALLDRLIDTPGHWGPGVELPVTWQSGQSIGPETI